MAGRSATFRGVYKQRVLALHGGWLASRGSLESGLLKGMSRVDLELVGVCIIVTFWLPY